MIQTDFKHLGIAVCVDCGQAIDGGKQCPECREQDEALNRAWNLAQERRARKAYQEQQELAERTANEQPKKVKALEAALVVFVVGLLAYIVLPIVQMFIDWIFQGGN